MTTIQDLIFAIDETERRHPDFSDINFASIYGQILAGADKAYTYITSSNGARAKVAGLTSVEIAEALCEEIVRIYNYCDVIRDAEYQSAADYETAYNAVTQKCPEYETICRLIIDFQREKVNPIAFLLENNKILIDVLHIVNKYHFEYEKKYREVLDKYSPREKYEENFAPLINKIRSSARTLNSVKNVHVNQHAVNKCYHDVMNGIQIKNRFNEYGLNGTLFATQHIGNVRKNQEDSVLIMEHPANPNFKILVVADGMGGGVAGEEVSSYTVKEIALWFQSLSPDYYNKPEDLQRYFNQKIAQISEAIYAKYNDEEHIRAGSTFTGAIVTSAKTIITQIGDSRAYIIKNGSFLKRDHINLITSDDSYLWPRNPRDITKPKSPLDMSEKEIDDLKYHVRSNMISRCIGDNGVNPAHQSFTIPNDSYDKLLLMSDGASDLLSFEGIKIICRSTPLAKITSYLVEAALKKKAIRGREWNDFYEKLAKGTLTQEELDKYNSLQGATDNAHRGFIAAGKDNTTVAGYFKDDATTGFGHKM